MPKTKTFEDLHQAECWIFDLDNTLYLPHCRLFAQIETQMTQFICQNLRLNHADALTKQKLYFQSYGTTLRGLMLNDGIDPHDFLHFVHDIDYSILAHDAHLNQALGRLTARKIIFTNGSVAHAECVLQRLGIRHHFEAIFDIIAADFQPKPHAPAYRMLLQTHAVQATSAVMVEDIAKNLEFPHNCGMATLWIENDHEWCQADNHDYVHFATPNLADFLHQMLNHKENF